MTVKLIYNYGTGWMTGVSGFDSLRGQRIFSVFYLDWPQSKSFYFQWVPGLFLGIKAAMA